MNAHVSKILATAMVTSVLPLGIVAPASGSTRAAGTTTGVCAAVPDCHRAVVADVDGDRRRDRVAWRRLDRRHVQIRVRTDGRVLRRSIVLRRPMRGLTDASRVDGRRGSELVVGPLTRASATQYVVLTYRRGRLVVQRPPQSPDRRWSVADGAVRYAGWHRRVWPSGRVTMTLKTARRDGDSIRLWGRDVRYEWRDGSWQRTRSIRTRRSVRAAERIAGWHVGGPRLR